MGRRKLRFDVRKNYERRKYGLRVRIPMKLLKPSQLMVKVPISAYLAATVPDTILLRSRLLKSNLIPSGWSVLEDGSQSLLVLYKLQQSSPMLVAPSVTFSLSIDVQCTWMLRLGESEISQEKCPLLRRFPSIFRCAEDVVQLLLQLDESEFCVGNPDGRFSELVDNHKGKFMNQCGK